MAWYGPRGCYCLFAGDRETDAIVVYDAIAGRQTDRLRGPGPAPFRGIDAITVIDDMLLVADTERAHVKIYTLAGVFTGKTLGAGILRHEPEGIALFACHEGDGYWIVTEGDPGGRRFRVFGRSGLRYRGAFAGKAERATEASAPAPDPVGAVEWRSFYALGDRESVAAFRWSDIAAALGLQQDCGPLAAMSSPLLR